MSLFCSEQSQLLYRRTSMVNYLRHSDGCHYNMIGEISSKLTVRVYFKGVQFEITSLILTKNKFDISFN